MGGSRLSSRPQRSFASTTAGSISADTPPPAVGRRSVSAASSALQPPRRVTRSSSRLRHQSSSPTRIDKEFGGGEVQRLSNGLIAAPRPANLSPVKDLSTALQAAGSEAVTATAEVVPSSLPPSQDLTPSESSLTPSSSGSLVPSSLPSQLPVCYSSPSPSNPGPHSFSSFLASVRLAESPFPREAPRSAPLPLPSLPPLPSSPPLSPSLPTLFSPPSDLLHPQPPSPPAFLWPSFISPDSPLSSGSSSTLVIGPQRECEPSLIASPQGGGDGVGPLSPNTGEPCVADAADGEERAESEEEKENRWVNVGVRSRPLYALIAADPSWVADGVQVKVWTVDTLGGGRCVFPAIVQALKPDLRLIGNKSSLQFIDAERRRARTHAEASYTLQRWITEVPWEFRTMEASPQQTSLAALLQRMSKPTEHLSACCLHVLSDMYKVGIYLIVRSVSPADNERDGGGRAGEYYHIKSPTVTSTDSIVLFSSGQHYETCEWLADDGVMRTRLCTVGSRMHTALELLCRGHLQAIQKEAFDLGDDTDVAFDRQATRATQPKRNPPRRCNTRMLAGPGSPAPQQKSRKAGRHKSNSPITPAKAGPSGALGKARGCSQKAQKQRRKQAGLTQSSSIPPLPLGSGPLLPSDIARHGELYSCVSFTNVPQWVGLNTVPWNAYRLASQNRDRNAKNQAVEDMLMLPQRVLTRMKRGGADGSRLTRTIRARCRDVGEELRRHYPCPIPREESVQLTVTTVPLVHQASAAHCPAADTAVSDVDSDQDAEVRAAESDNSGDDADCDARSLVRAADPVADDADSWAARKAQFHVKQGHLRKAAQVLHSTTTMADMRIPEIQSAVEKLHPPLPEGSVLPILPADSPLIILEDDDAMRMLIRQSNNGSASGPSGWGGNLLSTLAESDVCRAGIIALLKDIINGDLPRSAQQLLLSSRLVALNKPSGDGLRPIAMGELFYRLAALIMTRKVALTAASLLSPHQYGVGVSSGAECVVHSLQHALTDNSRRLSLLQVDISNAFNACDRGRILRELYSTPQLSPLYRMVDFAYSTPSVLLLERGEGKAFRSRNGVRQGDPLSALLFCVYMREVLSKVAERADVQLYGFFDDLNVVGAPAEVLKAFDALRSDLLPAVSLTCNTSKSHFAYFHEIEAPLMRSQRLALAEHNVEVHNNWVHVLGAVVGKDEAAIIDGITVVLGDGGCSTAFFRRVQSDVLHFNSAMLLLRHCGVPQLNYLLRCTPPSCIAHQAAAFDEQLLVAAALRLGGHYDQFSADAIYYMQAKLRHGGVGLTSAVRTSPAAYLGSLAAVATAPEFAPYTDADCPLESDSLLLGWIEQSVQQVVEATPSLAATLPTEASAFFHHITTTRSSTSASTSLQRQLSSQAALHSHKAFLSRCWEMRKVDGGVMLAHAKAVCAPRAWTWKNTIPMTRDTDISDEHYQIAVRMNVLVCHRSTEWMLYPIDCPLCKKKNAIRKDQWHFLTCDTGASQLK